MRERGRKSRGYGHEGVSHARIISPRPRAKNKPSTSQHDKKDAIELAVRRRNWSLARGISEERVVKEPLKAVVTDDIVWMGQRRVNGDCL